MAFGSVRLRGGGGPKRFNKISIRTSWKVIVNHPFFVATLLYLIILHRYFPLLFSLLVSASPVLICTALLLGILLIHGQQHHRVVNVSERNVDDGRTVDDSVNNEIGDFAYSVDKDGLFSVDRFGEIQKDMFRKEVAVSREFESRGKTIDDFRRLSQRSNQTDSDKEGLQFGDFGFKNVQTHELRTSFFDEKYDKTANVRHDSAFSSQKLVDSATNHESSYSECDGAEKFSLDVLVAEVTPTLQETHPLLESEDLRHLRTSQASSFKSETQSHESIQSSESSDEEEDDEDEDEKGDDVENDETPKAIDGDSPSPFAWTENDQKILQELRNSEMEKNEHLESLIARAEDDESEEHGESNDDVDDEDDDDVDVDVEVDDDDDDENVDSEKDGVKQVTLWTEEDEKNLRHLGCSELERNLRLENLLARRRAKRNFSMISERNLIDLDKFVLPSPVPPISTARINPFENSDDTSHHSSAQPIPGSAPSVTLPRKNPFDSPCTSPKRAQTPGLESVKESPVEISLKNSASHENGSSSTGYNTIGHASKPENRKESLFRRYESFSSGFNVTEDSSSTDDFVEFDRKNFVFRRHETFNTRTPFPSFFNPRKPVFVPEQVAGEEWHPSLDRQLSQDTEYVESGTSSESELSTAPDNHEYVEHQLEDQESNNEGDHTSNHMETGSESSEAINSQYSDQDEHNAENMEMNEGHVYQSQEVLHDGHDDHDDTSSTSASEHNAENESQTEQEQVEVSGISSNMSLNMSEASHMSTDDDHLPVEPVYDTSPSGAEKITAFTNPSEVEMK
ncbi:hypothetical protein vseg_008658 [Gypsophila vaccaria]